MRRVAPFDELLHALVSRRFEEQYRREFGEDDAHKGASSSHRPLHTEFGEDDAHRGASSAVRRGDVAAPRRLCYRRFHPRSFPPNATSADRLHGLSHLHLCGAGGSAGGEALAADEQARLTVT